MNGIIQPGTIISALHTDFIQASGRTLQHITIHPMSKREMRDYQPFPGLTWQDHFTTRKHFYKVLTVPTNNSGYFLAMDAWQNITSFMQSDKRSEIKIIRE